MQEDKLPIIGESVLLGQSSPSGGRPSGIQFDLSRDNFICLYTGPKGSGKTMLMTGFAIKAAYLYGYELFSNYPIKCRVACLSGNYPIIESKPLDMELLYRLENDLDNSIVLVDELPLWADSRTSGRLTNRLLDYSCMMSRKRHISYFFSSQFESWVDNRLRAMCDIKFACSDLSKKYPASGIERGSVIALDMYDMSGQLSGQPYGFDSRGDWGFHRSFTINAKSLWGTYDTLLSFDALDISTTKVDIKTRNTITVDKTGDVEAQELVNSVVSAMQSSNIKEVDADKLAESLGVENLRRFGRFLKKAGLDKHQVSGGSYIYNVPVVGGQNETN